MSSNKKNSATRGQKDLFLEKKREEIKEEIKEIKKKRKRRARKRMVKATAASDERKAVHTYIQGNRQAIEKWISNHYLLQQCFLIPREQRAHVQVHKWDFKFDLSNVVALDPNLRRLLITMSPSIDEFLGVGIPGGDIVVPPTQDGSPHETQLSRTDAKSLDKGLTQDENFDLADGTKLKAGIVTGLGTAGYKYATQDAVKSGCKMYPGAPLGWQKMNYHFLNTDSVSVNVDVIVLRQFNDGHVEEKIVDNFSVSSTTPIDGTCGVGWTAAEWEESIAFGFGFRITNASTIGNIPSGFKFKMGFNDDNQHVVKTVTWKHYSVWQVLEDASGSLRKQYENSLFHCFTAMHVTMTNIQSQMYDGGSILAHQLPGRGFTVLPHTFDGISSFIGSRTFDVLESVKLKEGFHWNYRWEKVQDTFFIGHDRESFEDSDRPSLIAALQLPQQLGEGNQYGFAIMIRGALQIEYITEERDAPCYLSPPDTINLLARYCAIRADMPCLSENPKHLKMIASNVMKIMRHPVTKTIVREAGLAGLKLLLV